VSRRAPKQRQLDPTAAALLVQIVASAQTLLDAELLGFIGQDAEGVFITPRPGYGARLFKAFCRVDWASEARIAEEYET